MGISIMYIGGNGKGHHPAFTLAGNVYYGQVVDVSPEILERLYQPEWKLVDKLCRHIKQGNGDLCGTPTEEGEIYCKFHREEFARQAESLSLVGKEGDPKLSTREEQIQSSLENETLREPSA